MENAGKLDRKTANQIVDYMENGYLLAPMLFTCKDTLGSDEYITGCCSLLSDGVWVWRRDHIFYIRRHKVDPGSEFVSYILSQKKPPVIDEAALDQARRSILDGYEELEKTARSASGY